jgi:hypothetical protein
MRDGAAPASRGAAWAVSGDKAGAVSGGEAGGRCGLGKEESEMGSRRFSLGGEELDSSDRFQPGHA